MQASLLTALLTLTTLQPALPADDPAARAGLEGFTAHGAELATGIRARWIELGDPRGEPVLFLHGYTDTSRSFAGTMRALAELRPELRLMALDQRGHGGSSLPRGAGCPDDPGSCFGPAELAADALALLDQAGIARAHVVGHSLGTFVAQELALAHPERVARMVLIATSARAGGNAVLEELVVASSVEGPWKAALTARGLAFPRDAWGLEPRALAGAEEWIASSWAVELGADSALLAAIAPETAATPLGTWIGVPRALAAHDNRARLAELRVPTLVLWPVQDVFFREEPDQRELRAALARAAERHGTPWAWKRYGRAELGAAPSDLGHNLQWVAPEAVARDLAAFLRPDGAPTRAETYLEAGARVRSEPQGALVLP